MTSAPILVILEKGLGYTVYCVGLSALYSALYSTLYSALVCLPISFIGKIVENFGMNEVGCLEGLPR